MDIFFSCETCGQDIVIDEAGAGQVVECPKCNQTLLVPSKSTRQAVPHVPPRPVAAAPQRNIAPPVVSQPLERPKTADSVSPDVRTARAPAAQPKVKTSSTSNLTGLVLVGLGILALVGGIYVYGYVNLQQPLNAAIQSDPRNVGIEVGVHYENWIPGSAIVYDLQKVSGSSSPADVFRLFLQYAAKMKDERLERVLLAYRGNQKFYIDGSYFRKLGEELDSQNPIYTIRTFPENVRRLNGTAAYEHWEGGIFAVAKRQMEDFEDFYKDWFVNDLK